ncbi:copper amine oxidase N-terminal domain-containing protein [Acetivibrio cellulolyticus]
MNLRSKLCVVLVFTLLSLCLFQVTSNAQGWAVSPVENEDMGIFIHHSNEGYDVYVGYNHPAGPEHSSVSYSENLDLYYNKNSKKLNFALSGFVGEAGGATCSAYSGFRLRLGELLPGKYELSASTVFLSDFTWEFSKLNRTFQLTIPEDSSNSEFEKDFYIDSSAISMGCNNIKIAFKDNDFFQKANPNLSINICDSNGNELKKIEDFKVSENSLQSVHDYGFVSEGNYVTREYMTKFDKMEYNGNVGNIPYKYIKNYAFDYNFEPGTKYKVKVILSADGTNYEREELIYNPLLSSIPEAIPLIRKTYYDADEHQFTIKCNKDSAVDNYELYMYPDEKTPENIIQLHTEQYASYISSTGEFSISSVGCDKKNIIILGKKDNTYYTSTKPFKLDNSKVTDISNIIFEIGNPKMTINNRVRKNIDQDSKIVPIIKDSRTLLPVRAFVEELGGTVLWDATKQQVKITYKDKNIVFTLGSNEVTINNNKIYMDVTAQVINQRSFIPLRFLSETMGFDVQWDKSNTNIINIIMK